MDCSLPGSSVHGILQARVLEWGAIAFSASEGQNEVNRVNKVESSLPSCVLVSVNFLGNPKAYVRLALPMCGRVRYSHSGAGRVIEVDQMASVVEVCLL